MILIELQVVSAILSENKCSLLFPSHLESLGNLMKDDVVVDLDWPLKVISGTVNGFIVCISEIRHTVYEVNANGWMSYMSSCCCYIWPEGLLCDAECYLLVIGLGLVLDMVD